MEQLIYANIGNYKVKKGKNTALIGCVFDLNNTNLPDYLTASKKLVLFDLCADGSVIDKFWFIENKLTEWTFSKAHSDKMNAVFQELVDYPNVTVDLLVDGIVLGYCVDTMSDG